MRGFRKHSHSGSRLPIHLHAPLAIVGGAVYLREFESALGLVIAWIGVLRLPSDLLCMAEIQEKFRHRAAGSTQCDENVTRHLTEGKSRDPLTGQSNLWIGKHLVPILIREFAVRELACSTGA